MIRQAFYVMLTGALSLSIAVAYASDVPEGKHRRLLESSGLPDDVVICDEYFFGHQSLLPFDELPFCVNNGTCKASWIRNRDQPCVCSKAFDGPHCEFKFGQLPSACSLHCQHGSTCKLGAPSWQHFYRNTAHTWTNPLDMQHCACQPGYTGLLCEVVGVPCGNNFCHNGGTCVQTTQSDGSVKHFCDCTTAEKNVSGKVVGYAGEFCEHEATSLCTDELGVNGNQFCVNGGGCKSETHLGCNCKTGYVGPVCEFEDNGETSIECDLTCKNHGICRKGAKDVSLLKKFGFDSNTSTAYNQDFQHCVCPRGYVGVQCEYQLDLCPGGVHACLNGGECVTVPNGSTVEYACDCTNAQTAQSRFAGEFCEMESTQFCTIGGGKSLSGVGINAFCTNGGTCRKFVQTFEEHPGCDCPKEFEGKNCQFPAEYGNHGPNVAAVVSSIFAVAGVALAGLYIKKRRKSVKYDHVQPTSKLPPTLDIIHSLRHDKDDEFEEGSRAPKPKGISPYTRSTSVLVEDNQGATLTRKKFWSRGNANRGDENPIHIFNDVDLDEDEIRSSRKTYWPNDACNDATNPIHVFDDISIRSESINTKAYTVSSMGSDDRNCDSTDSEESQQIV